MTRKDRSQDPKRPSKSRGAGSQTNASDAVDDIELPAGASTDEVVDSGVMETFPASDPIAVGSAHHRAKEREAPAQDDSVAPPKPRSPDWLLRKK